MQKLASRLHHSNESTTFCCDDPFVPDCSHVGTMRLYSKLTMESIRLTAAVSPVLCGRCPEILNYASESDGISGVPFERSNFHDLKASADLGCRLCSLICASLEEESMQQAELLNVSVSVQDMVFPRA